MRNRSQKKTFSSRRAWGIVLFFWLSFFLWVLGSVPSDEPVSPSIASGSSRVDEPGLTPTTSGQPVWNAPPPPQLNGDEVDRTESAGTTGSDPGPGREGGDSLPLASAAIVVFAFNRPDYLKQTMESLLALDGVSRYTVYISQDGNHAQTGAMAQSFVQSHGVTHWQRPRPGSPGSAASLAQHYKYGLNKIFFDYDHSHAIICEDDMVFAPDFLSYFEQTAGLLEEDPSLWCVSSWNDNGFTHLASDVRRLFRTSYFPGLGWMMRRELWEELSPKWPKTHWDHWMRVTATHKGRDCIVPEVSRNHNIGAKGVHVNQAEFSQKLARVAFNADQMVDFGDLSYLKEAQYVKDMQALVDSATVEVAAKDVHEVGDVAVGEVALVLCTKEDFPIVAHFFSLWEVHDRATHRKTSVVKYQGKTVIVADRRLSPYLRGSQRLLAKEATVVPAQQGESCTATCAAIQRTCDMGEFDFYDTCEHLAAHFPCAGCHHEFGQELPAFVSDTRHDNAGLCLTTTELTRCESKHPSTSRLCPCV